MDADCSFGRNLLLPYGGSLTFSTADGKDGTWKQNTTSKGTSPSVVINNLKLATNYYPITVSSFTGAKYDYVYGNTSSRICSAPSDMKMMSMCSAFAQNDDTGGYLSAENKSKPTVSAASYGTNMKYGTQFSHSTYGPVKAFEMIVDNPDVMYIDYAVLGIFGYPLEDATTTIADMIPSGKTVTLELFPVTLTLSSGKYNYTKTSTTPIVTATATADDFTADSKSYYGALKFDFEGAVPIDGDYVGRITWDDGCNFGLETDLYSLQKYSTFYCFEGKNPSALWAESGVYNANISYHAMFPALYKGNAEQSIINFLGAGSTIIAPIRTNVNPEGTDGVSITKPDWVEYSIEYEDETFDATKGINISFTAAENTTGEERNGTITISTRGKEISYEVSQGSASSDIPVESITLDKTEYTLEKGYKYTLTATVTPDDATDKSVTWSSSDETVVTVDPDGTIHYKKDGVATITAQAGDKTATCVVTTISYTDYVDFELFGTATGTWNLVAKGKKLENLPVKVCSRNGTENLKRIKVSNFNYDTSAVAKDIIIEWDSETNVCTVAQQSTGYAISSKTIYIITYENGSFNPSTGIFTLPIAYATTEKVIAQNVETLTMNHIANMTVGDAKWGTFFAPFDVTLPEGAFAYTVTVEDNKTVRNKIAEGGETVLANTAVLVYSAETINQNFVGVPTDETPVGLENALVGTLEPIASGAAPAGAYYLAKKNDVLNFYPAGQAKLAANRAYLVVPEGAKIEGLFEGEVTGINEVNAKNADSILRNIQGLPVNKGYKGIVIMDGKKYLKK